VIERSGTALRPLTRDDLAIVREWRNTPRIRSMMFTDHPIGPDEHAAWFAAITRDPNREALIYEDRGRPVGFVSIVGIDRRNGTCTWGIYVGADDAAPGSGKALAFCALEYIFERLELRKVYSEVFPFNQRALALYRRFGFEQEGLLKEHVRRGDRYADVIVMSCFRDRWLALKSRLEHETFSAPR
jgi:UDP-4-amino-4,6-dideoxy-N-acetyl-beta-L-altrosamine N-acetyltransferase